jgi:hypothetical protein
MCSSARRYALNTFSLWRCQGHQTFEAAVGGRVALEMGGALTGAGTSTGTTLAEAGNQGERLLRALTLLATNLYIQLTHWGCPSHQAS